MAGFLAVLRDSARRRCNESKVIELSRSNGPGIEPSQLKHLFQPFVRGDSARTTSGTGLGLAIVQRIIDAHAGSLDIGRSPRGGLRIRAYLPLPVEKAVATALPQKTV